MKMVQPSLRHCGFVEGIAQELILVEATTRTELDQREDDACCAFVANIL